VTIVIVDGTAVFIALAGIFVFIILQDNSTFMALWNHQPVRILYWMLLIFLPFSPFVIYLFQTNIEYNGYPVSHKLNSTEQAALSSSRGTPLFALISDTHLTNNEQTLEHQTGVPDKLRETLKLIQSINPPVLIVSGDLTDLGEEIEWAKFESLLCEQDSSKGHNRSEIKTLLVPGNHDFQGDPYVQAEQVESNIEHDRFAFVVPYIAREVCFLKLAKKIQGDLLTADGGILGKTNAVENLGGVLKDARNKQVVSVVVHRRNASGLMEPETRDVTVYPAGFDSKLFESRRQFDGLFPMIYEDAHHKTAFILLNSSVDVFPGASMGRGSISQPQIDRLRAMLHSLSDSVNSVVVVLHHPPVRRESDLDSLKEHNRQITNTDIYYRSYLALKRDDAANLVSTLENFLHSRSRVQVIVVYGHRHGPANFRRTDGGLWMLEAPSVVEEPYPQAWVAYRDEVGQLSFRWITSNGYKTPP